MNKYNFKLGDYVEIIGGKSNCSQKYYGRKGRIIELSEHFCELDICKNEGGLWINEIKLVKREIKVYGISKFLDGINKKCL